MGPIYIENYVYENVLNNNIRGNFTIYQLKNY